MHNTGSSFETFTKVMRYIGRYRFLLVLSIILSALTVILTLYVPVLFGDAIDCIVEQGMVDFAKMGQYLSLILILILVTSVLTWLMNIINNRVAYCTICDIRKDAIRKIQLLPLKYLDGQSTGDIVGRIIADADQLSDGLLLGLTQLFSGVLTIVVTLYFMFTKSFVITLLVLVMTPISFLVAKFIATRSYTMFRKQTDTRGRQTALVEEMVGNMDVVKAFGYGDKASERFAKVNEELQKYSEKAVFFSSITNPSTRAVNNVIYAIVALAGAFLVMHSSLTVGGLAVMLSYANQYMKPFNDISSVVTELQNALACAYRIFALLEQEEETAETSKSMGMATGVVDIEHVQFGYVAHKPVIHDFDVHVKSGMKVALVGPTGCGKTTLINLLMRFYDVDKGTILVDGKDITSVTRHSLRKNFGMVLQDTWLKEGTIRENITFGKPDATEEEIISAAKQAHSYEFIRRLPDGFDTKISEDSLSAGQKQLLCITRVMLDRPPVLILDEATSSIDTRTEMHIQKAFDELMKGRTSFIVAHRLSTIRSADLILVMKDGRIIERGTHESLLAENGFYTNLYNSQFAGIE